MVISAVENNGNAVENNGSAVENNGSGSLTLNSPFGVARVENQPKISSPIFASAVATNQHYGEGWKEARTFLKEDQKPQSNFPSALLDTICLEPGFADALFDILSPLSSPICDSTVANNQQYGEPCKAAKPFLTKGQKPLPYFPPALLDTICLEPGYADADGLFDIISPLCSKGARAIRTVDQISLLAQEGQPEEEGTKAVGPLSSPFCSPTTVTNVLHYYGVQGQTPQPKFPPDFLDSICLEPGCADSSPLSLYSCSSTATSFLTEGQKPLPKSPPALLECEDGLKRANAIKTWNQISLSVQEKPQEEQEEQPKEQDAKAGAPQERKKAATKTLLRRKVSFFFSIRKLVNLNSKFGDIRKLIYFFQT
jgi:hypothetical protein